MQDAQKIDLIYKLLRSRGFTSTSKKEFEEHFKGISVQISPTDIWLQASSVPGTPPGASTSVLGFYDDLTLTKDSSIGLNKVWVAAGTPGDVSTRLSKWINPSKFGKGYKVKLYEDDGLGDKGAQISTIHELDWTFIYEYGLLICMEDPDDLGLTLPLHISGYNYIGTTGVPTVEVDGKFQFTKGIAGTSWVISGHGLNKHPSVTVTDASDNILMPNKIDYVSNDAVTLTFLDAVAGVADLN